MSVVVQFVFNGPGDLADVARAMQGPLGVSLLPYQGDPNDFFGRHLGIELSLPMQHLKNDGECDFESYRFVLDTRTPSGEAELRRYQLTATALLVGAMLINGVATDGILVQECDTLLARYAFAEDGTLSDLFAGTEVLFPDHLMQLQGYGVF
jgi:hypothetical protein